MINIIDNICSIDFALVDKASLAVTDGALIAIDAVDGITSNLREILHQAIHERIQPVIILTKIDELIQKFNWDAEAVYQYLANLVTKIEETFSVY